MAISEHTRVRLTSGSNIAKEYVSVAEHSLNWLASRHLEGVDSIDIQLTLEPGTGEYQVSTNFLQHLANRKLKFSEVLSADKPLVLSDNGKPDYLSTIIYMMNYLQEYDVSEYDVLGRFRYEDSYQYAFGCVEQNLVLEYFKQLLTVLNIDLDHLVKRRSKVFVSHDVDTMFRGFWQDGFSALKGGRFDLILRLMVQEISGKPVWFNLDHVMDVTEKLGFKSTFFWLSTDKKENIGGNRMWNADYKIRSRKILSIIDRIKNRGFELGLHKSISKSTFKDEMEALPFETTVNRNHFLKLRLPNHLTELDEAEIIQDYSLGFAEHFGFRNSYALPYRPFNLETGKPSRCLLTPLAIMETTNWTYMRLPLQEMKSRLLRFVQEHQNDALISILWHNNHFSEIKFKGYTDVYEALLGDCQKKGLDGVKQKEVLEQFG